MSQPDNPSSPAARSTDPIQERGAELLAERSRIERLSRIRQLVFGSLDGLIVPLGVVSGVAGFSATDSGPVIAAGIAEAFAGALSMGAGEFIAGRSEAQVQQSEVLKELKEMEKSPEFEQRELAQIYQQQGVAPDDARLLVTTLARYPKAYQQAMVANELGINTLEPETVKLPESLTIGGAYLVGSFFPLIAYFFFKPQVALPISLVLTFIALVAVGYMKGKLASMNLLRSIVEIVVVGLVSAGGGYVLGTFIPRMFGY